MQVNMDATDCKDCKNDIICKYVDTFYKNKSCIEGAIETLKPDVFKVTLHCSGFVSKFWEED